TRVLRGRRRRSGGRPPRRPPGRPTSRSPRPPGPGHAPGARGRCRGWRPRVRVPPPRGTGSAPARGPLRAAAPGRAGSRVSCWSSSAPSAASTATATAASSSATATAASSSAPASEATPTSSSSTSAAAALSTATAGIAGAPAARGAARARLTRGATALVAAERAALAPVRARTGPTRTRRRLLRGTRSLPALPARLTAWCRRPPAPWPRPRPRPRGRLLGASPGGLLGGTCPAGLPAVEAARHVPIRAVARRHLIPAAVLLRGGLVPVRHAAAVLGVVLPLLPAALASRSVAALVDVLFLVLVDVDVLITATTSAVVVVIVDLVVTPVTVTPYGGADRHPGAEREQARRGDVAGRIPRHCGVVRRRGRAVHRVRAVRGDVYDLRVRGLDPDDLLLLDDLAGDDLLLRRLEGTGLVCLRPHPLHHVEDDVLLAEERIPQILRPVEIVRHALEQVGKARERLHARVPVLALERLVEGLALQTRVLRAPASSLHHLEGIGRRDQDLHGEPVRIA